MEDVMLYSISVDATGKMLDGTKSYKLHLPSQIPACNFWSLIVYDSVTRLMITTDQKWPSIHSNSKKLVINKDGSVEAWFGPEIPVGKEGNWIKTIPGKAWYMIMRLYNPTESGNNILWKPGEIEKVTN